MSLFKFSPGTIVATPGALDKIEDKGVDVLALLSRHLSGDWGDLDAEDKAKNDEAVLVGTRLLSAYVVDDVKFWIITEWDRSVTTILLPEEY